MAEWVYFIHPPRENFASTMTEQEEAVWSVHFERPRLPPPRPRVDKAWVVAGLWNP